MKNRAERIADAEFKLMGIRLAIEPLQKHLSEAEVELNRAKASYDIGERVRVEETCRRGCCVENEYEGTVIAEEKNGTWRIKATDGHVYQYVYGGDMKRL